MQKPNSNIVNSQSDPRDTEIKKSIPPHDWYNLHIRKEGQRVLTKEEFDIRVENYRKNYDKGSMYEMDKKLEELILKGVPDKSDLKDNNI